MNNIFLTGAPSSGKTTIIKKIIKGFTLPAKGFYTEEERLAGKRVGFIMKSLCGQQGYLAHENIQSDFRIRRYGVSIENIDHIAVPSLAPENDHLIVLDEIGKMECFSPSFKNAAIRALDAKNIVIGTITLGGDPFIRRIKTRQDLEIIEVTPENRERLPEFILEKITSLKRAK